MCNIQNMLNSFINGKNINLAYEYQKGRNIWRDNTFFDQQGWGNSPHDEDNKTWHNVDAEFANFHAGFKNSLEDTINNIFDWGFGEGFVKQNKNLSKSYVERIEEIQKSNADIDRLVFERDFLGKSISSWSKVLAAYTFGEQNKYFIYDSRVAIALNIIDEDHYWFLPEGRGNNIVAAMIKQKPNNNKFNLQDSYKNYCKSLRNQGGVTLERQLFMLGGYLDYTPPEDWRTHIDVKIPENKKKQ